MKKQTRPKLAELSRINQLPIDLLVDILSRISSVKSLFQCKSVCKSWFYLMENESFIDLHLNRQLSFKTTNYNLVNCCCSRNQHDIIIHKTKIKIKHYDAKTLDKLLIYRSDLLVESGNYEIKQFGSCNGLLLANFRYTGINYTTSLKYLCNPAIGQIRRLPVLILVC